jgi:nitronate monooxygenase
LVGTRFWASTEALVHPNHHAVLISSSGDSTVRTSIPDIARRYAWPPEFSIRVMRNTYIQRWTGREAELKAAIATEGPKYDEAFALADLENAAVIFGESAGLITEIEPASVIVHRMVAQAVQTIKSGLANVQQ